VVSCFIVLIFYHTCLPAGTEEKSSHDLIDLAGGVARSIH